MKQKIKQLIENFIQNTNNIATLNSRTLFVRENMEEIKKLTDFLPENSKVNERLYLIYNEIFTLEEIKCPMCNNNKKFYTFTSGYNLCCSRSCATKYQQNFLISKEQKEIIYKKRTENNRKKPKEVLRAEADKRIKTTIERYGENAFSLISKKGHQTKLKNGNNHYDRVHIKKLTVLDENVLNNYQRVHLKHLSNIDENGNNYYERRNLKNYETGVWTKPEDKTLLEQYKIKVYKFMYKFKEEIKQLKNFELRGRTSENGYHLDHKFSIKEGFNQKIDPEIIGHICNLEMIPGEINQSKNRKCSIELNSLINDINNYNTEKCIN